MGEIMLGFYIVCVDIGSCWWIMGHDFRDEVTAKYKWVPVTYSELVGVD